MTPLNTQNAQPSLNRSTGHGLYHVGNSMSGWRQFPAQYPFSKKNKVKKSDAIILFTIIISIKVIRKKK